ncbi:MAG: hypothetical protein UW30_C0001G0075 [Candidatus Giovannonibacteria bacterium GW2011_GWA2_44_13b]|uniref:Uncharacterized protein n=2 Tax=Candidatus Giovannoniibacteriota TaxID=1752738 RepID=A0A0G1H6D8_9BACT|nr:MAG: hypothetical protein UW30_C0001G0075 [Candidatus Giovannonibacteria bacterium GW2011_GWA2_44_13b]OGF82772.1 MAG: hypothetical protein A2924_04095 [Candidatus Giovannonibacteria bacterium RIFCSPLOWO2_01_FULL_44_16]
MRAEIVFPTGREKRLLVYDADYDPDLKTVTALLLKKNKLFQNCVIVAKIKKITSGFGQVIYEGVLETDEAVKVRVYT